MKLFISIVLSFLSLLSSAQGKYKPSIVVLEPLVKKYNSSLAVQIASYDYEISANEADRQELLLKLQSEPENIRRSQLAEFEYRNKGSFASKFSFGLYGMLTYAIFGQTDKGLILPSHDTSNGQNPDLKSVAKRYGVTWVINPISLETYIKNGEKYSSLKLQVYNADKNKIVLEKEYIGDSRNPGFELSCETGYLECTFNNLINQAVHDIMLSILKRYQH